MKSAIELNGNTSLEWKDSDAVDNLLNVISEIISREYIAEVRQNDPTKSDQGGEK